MTINKINLNGREDIPVSVELEGGLYNGVVMLRPQELPCIKINDANFIFFTEPTDYELINFKSTDTNFTLHYCTISGNTVYGQYLTAKTNNTIEFDAIEINIKDFQKLINGFPRQGKIVNNVYSLPLNEGNFDVEINNHKKIKRIYDYWNYWTDEDNEEGLTSKLFQQHIIRAEAKNPLKIDDVYNEVRLLSTFFSMITLINHSLNYIWLIKKERDAETKYPYYFSQIINETKDYNWYNSFINLKLLTNEQWHRFFNNAHHDEKFTHIWKKLCGMRSYKGYWEFDILGHISILDSWLENEYSCNRRKIPEALKKKLNSIIKDCGRYFDGNEEKAYNVLKQHLTVSVKQKGISFTARYDRMSKSIPFEIRNAIGLTNERFQKVKKLRDYIAHSNINLKTDGINFTEIFSIRNSVIILLTYISMRDIGVTDQEFSEFCLQNTNQTLLTSKFERKWINRYLKSAFIVNLTAEDASKIRNKTDIVISEDKSGQQYYQENLSRQVKGLWMMMMGNNKTMQELIQENLCVKDYKNYRCEQIGLMHIYYGEDDFLEIQQTYLIKECQINEDNCNTNF
ncbi:HEPN domain-containing protein [Erwinia mallotivora]|uniref:HEPN domain-containing protein n=1 Tax=Erwinia mallotivora TaxID=69222 RepID=UPI0021BF57C6|nr:HEPN domain-containing protein [Erwinia mallotivora]